MGAQALNHKAMILKTYSFLGLDDCDTRVSGSPEIIGILSFVLERSIRKNEKSLKASRRKDAITVFHGSKAPTLSIQQYLDRIYKYSKCSPSCFVAAYIYMERFLQKTGIYLTSLNVHRLLITSLMLASKFIEDECYNNAYYAKVGGVSTAEINRLETNFLFCVDFRLHIDVETFGNYCVLLEEEAKDKYQIEQPIRICGLGKSWSNRSESNYTNSATSSLDERRNKTQAHNFFMGRIS